MRFFLIYNIVITCTKLRNMRFLILLLVIFNFFNLKNSFIYPRNNSQPLFYRFNNFSQKSSAKLIYKDGILNIEGLNGNANVSVYTIIGNKVAVFYNIELSKFKQIINLEKETMYILRIELSNKILTYKFFAR